MFYIIKNFSVYEHFRTKFVNWRLFSHLASVYFTREECTKTPTQKQDLTNLEGKEWLS